MSTHFDPRQFTLGQFADALRALTDGDNIRFDFGYMAPTEPHSYRGFYDHLAFGYELSHDVTVGRVYSWALAAFGEVYTGYKGGEYVMNVGTPLWVANYSEAPSTAIVGLRDLGYGYVIIETAYVEV